MQRAPHKDLLDVDATEGPQGGDYPRSKMGKLVGWQSHFRYQAFPGLKLPSQVEDKVAQRRNLRGQVFTLHNKVHADSSMPLNHQNGYNDDLERSSGYCLHNLMYLFWCKLFFFSCLRWLPIDINRSPEHLLASKVQVRSAAYSKPCPSLDPAFHKTWCSSMGP